MKRQLVLTAESWKDAGSCAQVDPELFFPETGGDHGDAKKICAWCEVRTECLEYALAHDERYGVWGGLSRRERLQLQRSRSRAGPDRTAALAAETARASPPPLPGRVPAGSNGSARRALAGSGAARGTPAQAEHLDVA